MNFKIVVDPLTQNRCIETDLSDLALLRDPLLNKGMGFTERERHDFNLFGFLPPHEATIEEQRNRSYRVFLSKTTPLEKYLYLRDLQDSNEILFYNLLTEHITELMPIVYTPTVGLGCQRLSHIYRRLRGVFIAYPYLERIEQIFANHYFDRVKVIVVSDGERILGLGDQGAGGMGISIGKLSLYCACAGIHPSETLPILLDTGTDNPDLMNDPFYIGWRHPRVRGKDYDRFIDQFVQAVKKRFPHAVLQWEDFAKQNANNLLERYRDQLLTFNDDIQGTAAVAVGTLLAAIKCTGVPLTEQRIVIAGAGSAGCGIAKLIMQAMLEAGISVVKARARFFMVDQNGLLMEDMADLLPFQKDFAQSRALISSWQGKHDHISLEQVVEHAHPTVLIGVSAQTNLFNEKIIKTMAANTPRPIIFPLSNPETRAEATPADLMAWTNESAIMGTGSPFEPVMKNGQPFRVDQTNNCYIFPGMGLGVTAVKANRVTDKMFMAAAKALANCSPANHNPHANLLPAFNCLREVALQVAVAVAKEAIESSHSDLSPQTDLLEYIHGLMWTPTYLPYKKTKTSE